LSGDGQLKPEEKYRSNRRTTRGVIPRESSRRHTGDLCADDPLLGWQDSQAVKFGDPCDWRTVEGQRRAAQIAERPSAPTPSYSSSLHLVIAAAPVRLRLPEEGKPHLLDDALYTSIAGYRTLDSFSTRHALASGAHEVVLIESNKASMRRI
jgi:hypothetical protein